MSYNPASAIFARTNSSTDVTPTSTEKIINIDKSIIDGSQFDGTNLSANSNNMIVQCDVRFNYSNNFAPYAEASWKGGAVEDKARQVPPGQTGGLHSRDEFWGYGSSIRPVAQGNSYGSLTIYANNCLVIGVVI